MYQFALTDVHDWESVPDLAVNRQPMFQFNALFLCLLLAVWYCNVCLYVCELWHVDHYRKKHTQNLITWP